jgi:hypothetical protein
MVVKKFTISLLELNKSQNTTTSIDVFLLEISNAESFYPVRFKVKLIY